VRQLGGLGRFFAASRTEPSRVECRPDAPDSFVNRGPSDAKGAARFAYRIICEDVRKTAIRSTQISADALEVNPKFDGGNPVEADQVMFCNRQECRLPTAGPHKRSEPSGDNHLYERPQ
jgi:hypothetical protein